MKYFTGDPVDILTTVLAVEQQALVTDDAAYGTEAKEDVIKNYIEAAESQADAYAVARYPGLRYATVPLAYRQAILIIAKKRLLARREYSTATLDSEYSDVIRWLRDISEERANLSPDPNGETAVDDSGDVAFGFSAPGGVFSGDSFSF